MSETRPSSAGKDAGRTFIIDGHLPALRIPWPQCGHCGRDVEIDGNDAWCDNCLIHWDHIEDGAEAKPDGNVEGSDVLCEIVVGKQDEPHDDMRGNHYAPGPPLPCILPSGHEGEHLNPYEVTVTTCVLPPADGGTS